MLFTIRSHDTLPRIIVTGTEATPWVDVEVRNLLSHGATLLPSFRRGYESYLVATQPIIKLITSAVPDLYNAAACDKFFLQLCFGAFIHPFGAQRRRHCTQKFKENRVLTVTSMYILEVLCNLKKNCDIYEHNTRSKYDIHIQPHNTSLLRKSVLHMGARLYKKLPTRIKNVDKYNQFRKEVKSILLHNTI